MRLIDADELETWFAEVGYKRFLSVIRSIETVVTTGQWIPCNERMPERGKRVLVWTKFGELEIGQYYPEDVEWIICECEYDVYSVMAWMPLPEPYKEERDEVD